MKSKVNLELKYFCKDFVPVRTVLKEIGAKKIIIKKQKDYFFNLPHNKKSDIPARFKLRIENGKQTLIYYRRPDFSSTSSTPADIVLFPVKNSKLLSFLIKALGVRVVVEKTRELWKKGNTVFHLDIVKDIGNIFEIEVQASSKTMSEDRLKFTEYRKKLLPYLEKIIKGSNEDLVLIRKICRDIEVDPPKRK